MLNEFFLEITGVPVDLITWHGTCLLLSNKDTRPG